MATRKPRVRPDPTTVAELVPDPANRRTHNARNLEMVAAALRDVGAARSIVIDEDNVILAGNGVTSAAAGAGITRVRVVDAAGDELIAVRRRGLTDGQKRDLALYDNRAAELAAWNFDQLAADRASGLSLQPFWTAAEEAALLARLNDVKPGLTDPDAVPDARATSIKPGHLFALGQHRLLCGDATAAPDVARLLRDDAPFLMVTDPPYGVEYDPAWRHRQGLNKSKRVGKATNDDRADWTPAWELFRGVVAYVFHGGLQSSVVQTSLAAAGLEVRAQVIWAKPRMVIGRGHYHWQHEPCWYAVRGSDAAKWTGDRTQTTIWQIAQKDATGETTHGTQKPVECMGRPMANHGGPDDHVYDPFCGSGTTIIAAEQRARRCFAMEIEPRYVQMAIDRWEQFTGQTAAKV